MQGIINTYLHYNFSKLIKAKCLGFEILYNTVSTVGCKACGILIEGIRGYFRLGEIWYVYVYIYFNSELIIYFNEAFT